MGENPPVLVPRFDRTNRKPPIHRAFHKPVRGFLFGKYFALYFHMKILVVDDSSTFRKIACEELKKGGFEVLEAKDGLEALDVIRAMPVDMVTLDVEMPNLNGYETCKQLRSDEFSALIPTKDASVLPVIFITSNDTLQEREKGFHAGAGDFITKPFLPGELLSSINRILKPENRFKGLNALVVDDSSTTRHIVKQSLHKQGMTVFEAENGQEALDLLASKLNEIDIIITDFFMPVMDGKELCRQVRTQLNQKEIPILFLSTLSEQSYILELFKAGASDYLIKPFTQEELLARMQVHLNNRLLNKELTGKVLELKRLSQMKDKFLAICSHDLRSPLNSILGFTQLLMTSSLTDEEKNESLDIIQSSGNFLLSLIDDILDLGRLQSATDDLEMEPLSVLRVIETCIQSFNQMFSIKNIDSQIKSEISAEVKVDGNENALIRVFNNLLSNAIKFTPKAGSIEVWVELYGEKQVALSIIDSGIGIPQEKIPYLFDMFSKTSQSGTEGEKGTGLGLSITKQIVEKHQGKIEVVSEEGKGSTFKILLPTISNGNGHSKPHP
jgi:two-component system, sensor histidine kinase and response regulator